MTSRFHRMRPSRLLPVLAILLSLFLPSESSAFIRRDLPAAAPLFALSDETCGNVPVKFRDPMGLTAWEWLITGDWNPSAAALQGAKAGLHEVNKASQIVAGAAHVFSEAAGHLVDIVRGAAYSGALDYALVPGKRIPISDFYDVSPREFAAGSWGALAKKQSTQIAQGTYGAKELGRDVWLTELAINPVTGSGVAGYTVGTGIYEGDGVTVGEGAAQFGMLAAPYRGVQVRVGPSITAERGTPLYRAVTDAELKSIKQTGRLSVVPGSSTPEPGVQGKWFYGSLEDAQTWAGQAAAVDGGPLTIIRTTAPKSVDPAFSQPWVDNIKNPALFYDLRNLNAPINILPGTIP